MSLKPPSVKKQQAAAKKKQLPPTIKIAGVSILAAPTAPTRPAAPPTPGQLVLETVDPRISVTVRMDGPMKGFGGFGGWELEDTPREVQRVHWKGAAGVGMTGNLVIHNALGGSIEQRVAAFLRLGGRPPDRSEPPEIRITGNIEYPAQTWVMADRPDPVREVWGPGRQYRTSITFATTFYAANRPTLLGKTTADPYRVQAMKKTAGRS